MKWQKTQIGSQGMSGYYRKRFCVPTVHPIASTCLTTEANIIDLIPHFFEAPCSYWFSSPTEETGEMFPKVLHIGIPKTEVSFRFS